VSITVTVIDGRSGFPAEGVVVTIVGRPGRDQAFQVHGLTDARGDFTCARTTELLVKGEYYSVELDVDAYFASLGIVAGYKQITILVRVIDAQADYRMGLFVTPFAHATWGIR